jgi:protocatechuate 3,4-dioxygenase beta subunit
MKHDIARPNRLSARAIDRGRRDFMSWLLAVPAYAAIGCSFDASRDGEEAAEDKLVVDPDGGLECQYTSKDATGPYFSPGSPVRPVRLAALNEPGVRFLLEGQLFGPDCKTPLAGYAIDFWQADAAGHYHVAGESGYRLRGKIVTDSLGRYRAETILPGRYSDAAGWRPAHLHARMLTPGGNVLLTTQIYFAGDPYLGQADYCTVQGTCNSSDQARILTLADAAVSGTAGKTASFNAYLQRT